MVSRTGDLAQPAGESIGEQVEDGDPLQRPCYVSVLVIQSGNENRERRHEGRDRHFSDVLQRIKLMDTCSLLGSWISVGSEIDNHEAGSEAYHFFDPNVFLLEFKMSGQQSQISRSRFKATDDGFRYGGHETLPFEVIAWFESDHMIWRPAHGMETWFVRIDGEAFPDWVRGHHKMKRNM